MSHIERANRLAAEGRQAEAIAEVLEAAHQGDSEALLMVANWRLFGLYGPRNLRQAHELLEQAAIAGSIEAARTRALLIGNGTGCKGDPGLAMRILQGLEGDDAFAAIQLAFLPQMLGTEVLSRLEVQVLCEDPPVRLIRGLLLPSECRYLMTLAQPALQPSFVIDPRTGNRIPHPVRTSMGMSFGPVDEDLVIHQINRRLASVTQTDVSWGEPLHVLRYAPGQEYKPHVDALPGVDNQRNWTVLLYLNEDYQGGETHFPVLDFAVRGRVGDALIFRNAFPGGQGDARTRHAGRPVTGGEKWLATRWVRAGPYSPWPEEQARLNDPGTSP